MPLDGWKHLPRALRSRLESRPPSEPWLVHAAVAWLDHLMDPTWYVYEFGSGLSTTWFARRCQYIVSLENDSEWHARTTAEIQAVGLTNCDLRQVPVDDFLREIQAAPDCSLDLVVVDGDESSAVGRVDYALAALSKVKPGRYLVFDDYDKPDYRRMDEFVCSWEAHRFIGIKSRPLMAVETSVFRRPLEPE